MSSEIYINNQKVFSGITNYNELSNASKPQINSIMLEGNRTAGELNLMTKTEIQQLVAQSKTTEVLANYPVSPKEGVLYYIGSSAPYNVCLYAKNDQDVLTRVDLGTTNVDISSKQDVVDNNLTTTSKNIVGAINENKANVDLKQNITDDTLITTNKTIPTAINEMETDINALPNNYAPLLTGFCGISNGSAYQANNTVWDMDARIYTGTYRLLERKIYSNALITDPISNSPAWGDLEVIQSFSKATNQTDNLLKITQTFTANYINAVGSIREHLYVFKRIGYLVGATIDSIVSSAASITWKPWYPVEYPRFAITPYDTHVSAGALYGSITGGTLTVRGDNIRFVSGISTSTADICRIPGININAVKYVNGDNFQYSTLVAFNPSNITTVMHLIGLVKRVEGSTTQLAIACWRGDVDYPTANNQTTFFSVSCGLGY